ncbi:MAG: translation initiation factor IF-2 subunit alpha [archaeon]|nr:MAG: translation initiation factor IF-2 subunit alpha [archaeon]
MVRRKSDYPHEREIIIGTVKDINPYSVFVSLDEYPGRMGMIHVSELARKWVRDVRNWVKKGEKVVCLVLRVDREKGHVTLSLKRVADNQRNRRLQAWKRDEKGEKLLKGMAKEKGMTLDQIYDEIGFNIQENFRDMLEVFETALRKGEDYIKNRGIPDKWAKEIMKTAQEKIKIPEVKIEEDVELRSFAPDGVEKIRETLSKVSKKNGISVSYISAPKYRLFLLTKDPKEGEKVISKSLQEIKAAIEKDGGEFLEKE